MTATCAVDALGVDPLAGWTVAVTADRRSAEQTELLQRRGADVLLTPLVTAAPVPEADVRGATEELLRGPIDVLVASTGVGLRTWIAMSWTWDLGERLLAALQTVDVRARGAKAVGVLAAEDVPIAWRAPSETMAEVLTALLDEGVHGRRIGVQLHGGDLDWFVLALREAGAVVVPVPVYTVAPADSAKGAERLVQEAEKGELDVVTCTSTAAVAAIAAVDGLVAELERQHVVAGCVGPVIAAAARDAGLTDVVAAAPHRLGSLVRALGQHLADRGRTLELAGATLRHQGARLEVDGDEVRLTPRERRLLEVMLGHEGTVLSKERLAASAWDAPVDEHTVEVAVNRLRRKLGPAAHALETTARRGYRIAI
jgi:uroporphyrinogen-III synthase